MKSDRFGATVEAPALLVRVDLNEQAYQWVRERLLARHFGPGEKLGLQALADELGVSRSPVHQALTRLVSEGLVTTTRGQGYRVRPLTSRLMAETHDARAALELYAVEHAIGQSGRTTWPRSARRWSARSRRSETASCSTSSSTCARTRPSTS